MWPLWLPNRGGVIAYDAVHRVSMGVACFARRGALGETKSQQASKDSYITFQLTTKLRLLPVSAWPSHDGKEGDSGKS